MAENYEEAMPVVKKQNNTLPLYGNKTTMNLNSMILTNVQSSPYFKVDLFQLKTFHEVVDEIFYKVSCVVCDGLKGTLPCQRWGTLSRGRRTAGSWLDKLGCVPG